MFALLQKQIIYLKSSKMKRQRVLMKFQKKLSKACAHVLLHCFLPINRVPFCQSILPDGLETATKTPKHVYR